MIATKFIGGITSIIGLAAVYGMIVPQQIGLAIGLAGAILVMLENE